MGILGGIRTGGGVRMAVLCCDLIPYTAAASDEG